MLSVIMLLGIWFITGCEDKSPLRNPADMPYDVVIDPTQFEDSITGNEFFPLVSGTILIYEGEDESGVAVRVKETITADTKTVMGVTCIVVRAQEWEDGEEVEDTYDWYAQDKLGNVWYFGEDSHEISGGQPVSSAGSWEAGVDGALPGIIMLAHPIEGLWYRQEYWEGEAEDVAQVLSLNESVTVPYGTFTNCLQTAEWNPLHPKVLEHKYYASGVGVVKIVAVKGESGYEALTDIITE